MNPELFREKLGSALLADLPGEHAQLRMTPLSRSNFERAKEEAHQYRQSGVAVILFENGNHEREIALIQRPEYEGKHGGQVSFPGGKKEDSDLDLLETAMRECYEEIGVNLQKSHYLGALTSVFIPVSQFYVEPHVFFLPEKPDFIPDAYEVSEVFSIKVLDLLDDANVQLTNIRISEQFSMKDVPYFALENKVIWGATAVILSELKAILQLL